MDKIGAMKLEDHIFAGIEAFDRGEQEHALLHACIAVDSTSQKQRGLTHSTKHCYIQFIRDYYWILEPMTGSGINFNDTYWDNVPLTDQNGKRIEKLDMASFVYYLFRCTQVHGKEIQIKYKLLSRAQNSPLYYHIANDRLHIPETFIWGLLSICVFCKSNKDIKTNTGHFFTLGDNRFCISDWWGLEDSFRPIAEKHNPIRVVLQELAFSKDSLDVINQADDL
jgi:hypothetical protein